MVPNRTVVHTVSIYYCIDSLLLFHVENTDWIGSHASGGASRTRACSKERPPNVWSKSPGSLHTCPWVRRTSTVIVHGDDRHEGDTPAMPASQTHNCTVSLSGGLASFPAQAHGRYPSVLSPPLRCCTVSKMPVFVRLFLPPQCHPTVQRARRISMGSSLPRLHAPSENPHHHLLCGSL